MPKHSSASGGKQNKIKIKSLLKSLVFVFKKLYVLLADYRRLYFWGLVLTLILELLYLTSQYLFSQLVDRLIALKDNPDLTGIIWVIAGMAVTYLTVSVGEMMSTRVMVKTEVQVGHFLSTVVFQKFLKLSLGYHEKENTGAKLERLNVGLESIRRMIDRVFWDALPTITRIAVSFFFLMFIDWRISLAFIAIIPIFVFLTLRMNSRAAPLRKQIRRGFSSVYGKFGQAIYNVKTVQAYVQEDREIKEAKVGIAGIIRKQFRFLVIFFTMNFWRSNVVGVGNIIVIAFGTYLAYQGQITPGELVMFLGIATSCYYSLYGLSKVFDDIMEAKAAVDRIFEVLDSEDVIVDAPDAIKLDFKGKIEFRHVSFGYSGKKVLKDVNLLINQGEVVAVVGPSGGGKTTLVKLLYRYFDVDSGAILIDDVDLRKINLTTYRNQLGIVSQDIDIFDDTVAANIAYGRPGASMKDVVAAAKIANAHEFIEKMKKKYRTMVGERGIKLSGGQKQRIGIARAVLVNPDVLIMDEATSSLDAESERMIQQSIKEVVEGRTTIIIAHRLSTIKNADRIVVIDDGRIVEQGTHDELMAAKGVYRKLVKLQVGGYLSA